MVNLWIIYCHATTTVSKHSQVSKLRTSAGGVEGFHLFKQGLRLGCRHGPRVLVTQPVLVLY